MAFRIWEWGRGVFGQGSVAALERGTCIFRVGGTLRVLLSSVEETVVPRLPFQRPVVDTVYFIWNVEA